MTIMGRKKRLIDDELCFRLWVELGSLRKVVMRMEQEGIINPVSGKPFSEPGVQTAALRWICEHPEKARKVFIEMGDEFAEDDTRWHEFLVQKAMRVWTGYNAYRAWIRKNNFQKYSYVYGHRFPNLD